MTVGETRTVPDDGGGRESARDAWRASTMHYFRLAAEHIDRDPDRSLQELRKVLEGWAHLVCVVLDPTFRPYERQELRREPLARVLDRAREHLPAQRRNAIKALKTLADDAHHNQGHIQQTPPRIARAAALQCADLLEWLHTDVLQEPVPTLVTDLGGKDSTSPALSGQRASTEQTGRTRRGAFGLLVVGALVGFIYAIVTLPNEPAQRDTQSKQTAEPLPSDTPADGSASPTTSGAPRLKAPGGRTSDATALVRRYEAAIAGEDLEAILALHRFPTTRWFLAKDATRDAIRENYKGWFAKHDRRVLFEDCREIQPGVARCESRVDPPLEHHPGRVPTCLVFDDSGLLVSRTELDSVPNCPPAGLDGAARAGQ